MQREQNRVTLQCDKKDQESEPGLASFETSKTRKTRGVAIAF